MAINFPDSPSVNDTHTVGDRTWKWDGAVWNIVVGTTSDHGNLAGLSDDDHTQYLRTDGTRTAASLTVSGAVAVDTDTFVVDNVNDRVGIGTASPSTTLHVDGSILANDSVTIGDGGEYVAGSIYSDANWGMIFRAKQASPAAADFRWANSADTERMRIDTSGRVTMPYQPSFRAYLNVSPNPTYGSGWSVMSWNTTDFNVGGHYNTTNYRFTAPVAGKYLFTTSVNFYNIAQGDRFIVEFLKSNAYSYRLTDIDSYNAIGDDRNLGGSIIMNLSANDYVQVRAYGATANWRRSAGYNYGHFAGHFLG